MLVNVPDSLKCSTVPFCPATQRHKMPLTVCSARIGLAVIGPTRSRPGSDCLTRIKRGSDYLAKIMSGSD